jgi:tRNA pseudouridine55 synthase
MDGLLVIDKPAGLTSHDVVARMRRVLGERRIGHTGTLDPNASGVLPLVIGRATRLAKFLSGGNKTYEAVVHFGIATDSYDAEGTPVGAPWTGPSPARDEIERALDEFRGTFLQQPPAYSAKKIDGERSYKAARAARSGHPARPALPAPPAVAVTVHRLDLVSVSGEDVTLVVESSAGFYVRSLAHDLGARLGTGAHLAALRRTVSSGFTLDDAIPLEFAERSRDDAVEAVLPMESMLPQFAEVVLTDEGLLRALHGRDIGAADVASTNPSNLSNPLDHVRLVDQLGQLVAIAEPTGVPGVLHPSVVLR